MKTFKSILLLFSVVAAVSLTSCSDDDSSGGGATAGAGQLIATVDGAAFESITQGTQARLTPTGSLEFLSITAVNLGGEAITLQVTVPTVAEQAYDIDDANNISVVGTYTRVNTTTFQSTSYAAPYMNSGDVGTVTITELTATNVKGTFSFEGRNQNDNTDFVSVTNGSFNLALQ